jgi:hypothetical protein
VSGGGLCRCCFFFSPVVVLFSHPSQLSQRKPVLSPSLPKPISSHEDPPQLPSLSLFASPPLPIPSPPPHFPLSLLPFPRSRSTRCKRSTWLNLPLLLPPRTSSCPSRSPKPSSSASTVPSNSTQWSTKWRRIFVACVSESSFASIELIVDSLAGS